MTTLNADLVKLLTDGVLIEEYVLDNVRKLLQHVRSCNVTLRWFILHRTTTNKQFREMICNAVKDTSVRAVR